MASPPAVGSPPSGLRAWFYLIRLSLQRQFGVRPMTWISLSLLGLAVALTGLNTANGRWNMNNWRAPRRIGLTFRQWTYLLDTKAQRELAFGATPAAGAEQALAAAVRAALDQSDFFVFSNGAIFSVAVSFLLPIWSLAFATEALGGERESRSLVWLLTRPLSRSAIYLAKYLAQLPWSLGLCLGGFALVCLAGGNPGRLALRLYWPAVLCGTLALTALFHLVGAFCRRPAIVGLVYAFFLEVLLGNMPGYLKRVSISFYVRCMMFEAGQDYSVQPEKPWVYLPVDGTTACLVLVLGTAGLVGLGMWLFTRSEYVKVD
jgi:ABC-2 type transport system permease protein